MDAEVVVVPLPMDTKIVQSVVVYMSAIRTARLVDQ